MRIDGPLEFERWGDAWRRQEGHDSAAFTRLAAVAVVLDLAVGWVRARDSSVAPPVLAHADAGWALF